MNKNIGIVALAALLLAPLSAYADVYGADGSEAMGYSRVIMNPRQAAMGFAGSASDGNMAWSALSSSSAMAFSSKTMDAGAVYQKWAPDGVKASVFGLGGAYRFGKLAVSAGYVGRRGEKYDVMDMNGVKSGTFRPTDLMVGVGVGYRISESFSVGVNAKYLYTKLGPGTSYDSFASDITGTYRAGNFSVSAGVRNLGTKVEVVKGEKFRPSSSAMASASYRRVFGGVHSLEGVLDADWYFSGAMSAGAGAEYGYADIVFLRAGYHYGADDCVLPSFASLGVGVQYLGARIDFSYLTGNDYLGGTFTIGLGYSF